MSELSVPLRPACLKEGHPCPPSLPPLTPLSLLIPLPPTLPSPSSPPLAPSSSPPPPLPQPNQAGWRADVQTLSFRLGPHCQLRALLSFVLCVPDLSSCHPRPAASGDLIERRSFSSTSVNSNAVIQMTFRESGRRPS